MAQESKSELPMVYFNVPSRKYIQYISNVEVTKIFKFRQDCYKRDYWWGVTLGLFLKKFSDTLFLLTKASYCIRPSLSFLNPLCVLFLTFNNQYGEIHDISKYWFLLMSGNILSNYVLPRPSLTYRKAKSLGDWLISNHFVGENRNNQEYCPQCEYLVTRSTVRLPDDTLWTIKSAGIIYLMLCPCGSFYVGKTRREFRIRISEHIYCASIGFLNPP